MARKTLYSEYLKVLGEPDSPHKRRVMARMEAKYRNPPHPSDYGVPPKSKTKWIDPANFSNYSAPIRDLIQRDIKRESRRQVAAYYASRGINITADDGPVALGSKNLHKHFRGITKAELSSGNFSEPITFLDIETGHNYTPISTAALKGVIDKRTGEFRVIDRLERYYVPQNAQTASFNISRETHGITPDKARAIRALQQANYSETYNYQEKLDLLNFLKGSTIAGHNIEEFDLDKLGLRSISQNFNVIDTLTVAENLGIRRGKRGLADMFKKFTGRSLRQAGYSHHIGFHDVMSNAELFSALYALGGKAGRDIRYVTNHRGFSYAPYESVAGTSIVHGGFYNAKGHGGVSNYMYENEFDENGVFEYEYDENGRRILPEGYSEVRDDDIEPPLEVGSTDVMALKTYGKIASAYEALTEEMRRTREYSVGFNFSQESQLHARLANMPPGLAIKYAKNRGYKGAKLEKLLDDVEILRNSKLQRQSAKDARTLARQKAQVADYLDHLSRSGQLSKGDYEWLSQVNYVTDSGFSPTAVKYMAQEKAAEREEKLRDIRSQRKEELRKEKYLDRMERKGLISSDERVGLSKLTGSYEELIDATDELIQHNQNLLNIYQKFTQIKPYDVNQYLESAHSQWKGIMGAAKGVVPDFLLNPISRIGEASFNFQQGVLAPWNAFNRTWNATAGQVGNAALGIGMATGNPVALGIGGVLGGVSAISQIYGNYKQSQMEQAMLGIQNTLNTLGALTSWIATPFRLLHRAAKMLIGSFSGLTIGINNFMRNGIGEMSQMGNPLSDLTGINYASYEGTTMLDVASLFNRGSMNSIYEDFAKQQKAFYTLGQVNTNRLIASSLLGVYSDVYSPSTDAEGSYNNMVNKLLASMQGQSDEQKQRTMYLASEIDSNLPGLLRTANMLGVTDINTLTDPTNRGMYWRPLSDTQEQQYRWTQYEYGAATQQWGRSKMKISNMLWQAFGKDIYNGINGIVDMLSESNWKGAVDQAKQMWNKLKESFSNIWSNLKKEIFGDGEDGESKGWGKAFKILGLQITNIALEVGRTILNIWNTIMTTLVDKAEGLIAYLSTVSLEPHWDGKKFSFSINSVGTAQASDADKRIYNTYDYQGKAYITSDKPNEGMAGYAALADAIYGKGNYDIKATKTGTQVMADAIDYLRAGNALDLSDYGYYVPAFENGIKFQDYSDLQALFDAMSVAGLENSQNWKVGAWQISKANRWKIANFDDTVGYASGMRELLNQGMGVVNDTIDAVQNGVQKVIIELKATDSTGKTHKVTLSEGQSLVTKDLIQLRQLMASGVDLVVQQLSGN